MSDSCRDLVAHRDRIVSSRDRLTIFVRWRIRVSMKDAIGVGALNLDLIYRVEDLRIGGRKFTPGGEIIGSAGEFSGIVKELERHGKLIMKSGGGSAANCMYALGRMGFSVGELGMVGHDDQGDFLLASMEPVDTSRVKRFNGTGLAISMVAKNDRSLLILSNANDWFYVNEKDLEYVREAKVVHMTSFVAGSGIDNQKIIAASMDRDAILSFDPGEIYARKGIDRLRPLIERTNIVLLSDREAQMLTGMEPLAGCRKLMEMGPEMVACKMGGKGSTIVTREGETFIKARKTKVVDKTGAGDAYDAGFLAGILMNWSPDRCGEFATLSAAKSISSNGREGYPDEMTLRDFSEG